MSETKPQALKLLRKASDDLYALICLRNDPAIKDWSVGFHAQQAVEKAVKAILMQYEVRYPFTHDIETLIDLLDKASVPPPPDSGHLASLTPFGTLFRYEDEEWGLTESITTDRMLGWAEGTVAWARAILEGEER